MKLLIVIIAILGFGSCYAQSFNVFQVDSVYSINKVKARTMYSVRQTGLQKEIVTYYDQLGRKLRQLFFWNGEKDFHNVETFYYSKSGVLSELIDSFANGDIHKTHFLYNHNTLMAQCTIDQKSDTIAFRSYPREDIEIKSWYQDGKPYRFDTTIFEKENVTLKYFGVEHSSSNEIVRWHYRFFNTFDKNGNLIKVSSNINYFKKSFTRYFYDERSLLVKKQEVIVQDNKEVIDEEYIFKYE